MGSENILAEVGSSKALHNLVKKPYLIPVVVPGVALPAPLSRVWAQMLSAVPNAEEIAAKINSLIANLRIDSTTILGNVFAPETITLPWLREHVPVKYWLIVIGLVVSLLISSFAFGVKAGQIPWVASLFGEKTPSPSAPKTPQVFKLRSF